jgi:hypothetical protein
VRADRVRYLVEVGRPVRREAKDRIAWECPACGRRHLWSWPQGEASPGAITMICRAGQGCGHSVRTELVQIARDVWVAAWKGAQ